MLNVLLSINILASLEKHTIKSRMPKTIQDIGALFRREVVDNNLTKPYLTIIIKLLRLSTLHSSIVQQSNRLDRAILKVNVKLRSKIVSPMLHSYGDAKNRVFIKT